MEFIYTDEDKCTTIKNRYDPHFKPDFAIDTLRSVNYICHFSIYKKELMDKLGGFRSEFDGAQDYELILRISETTNKIVHISKILYHWRVHPQSTAAVTAGDAKPYAYEAGKRAIESHLKRVGLEGQVEHGISLGIYRVIYKVKGTPKVSILIPNMDHIEELKTCIDSIVKLTTYENYEIIVDNNVSILYDGSSNLAQELELLNQEKERLEQSIARREKLLFNQNYLSKAPQNIVDNERKTLEDEKLKLSSIIEKLN